VTGLALGLVVVGLGIYSKGFGLGLERSGLDYINATFWPCDLAVMLTITAVIRPRTNTLDSRHYCCFSPGQSVQK